MLLPSIFKLHNIYRCKIPDILGGKCPSPFHNRSLDISGQPSRGFWQFLMKFFHFAIIIGVSAHLGLTSVCLACLWSVAQEVFLLWFNVDVDIDAGTVASIPLGIEGLLHLVEDWSLWHAQFILLMILPGIVNIVCVAVGPAQSRWNSIYDRWYFSRTDKFQV